MFSYSFSDAVHTTMYTTKQTVPVEYLDWRLFPLIHSLGQLPHFSLNGRSANPETPKKWRNRTSDRESDGRFWIGESSFLFEFSSSHTSISLSFGDIRVSQTDRQTDRQRWPLLYLAHTLRWASYNNTDNSIVSAALVTAGLMKTQLV